MKELKDLQLYDKVGDVFLMCSKATNEIYLKSIN